MSIVEQHAQSMLAPAHGWKPPRILLPDLPAELWMAIFREATCVPHILDPDSVGGFCFLISRHRIERLRASLITKRYLVRVCKQWCSLATPYLYESVIIGRCRTLKILSDALQRFRGAENTDVGNGHPLGWWTKRLDVAMRDQGDDIESELESLSQIMQSLPNLKILVFRVTISKYHYVYLPGSVLHQLSTSAGPNLQAIVWYTEALTPDSKHLYTFLAKMPNIRTLSCASVKPSLEDSPPALPTLRTFYMPFTMRFLTNPAISIPSLRHLIFDVQSVSDVGWEMFLLHHGQQIEVIQVYVESFHGISHILDRISQSCSKLHRLDIAIEKWAELIPSQDRLSLPATIRTFGIYCKQPQPPRASYKTLINTLRNMKFGRAFKGVQLLHPGNARYLREHGQCPSLYNGQLGFEVLDHEGEVIIY